MKDLITRSLGLIIVVALILLTAFLLVAQTQKVGAMVDSSVGYETANTSSNASATTTVVQLYPFGQASTTIVASVNGSDNFAYNLCGTASTSSATLKFKVYYSMDGSTTTPNSTWFQETSAADSSGAVTHSLVEHSLTMSTTTDGMQTDKKAVCASLFSPATAKTMGAKKVMIRLGSVVSTTTIWNAIVPKSEI